MYKIGDVLRLTASAVSEDKGYTKRLKGFTVCVVSIETITPPLKLGVTCVTGTLRIANNESYLINQGAIITCVNNIPVKTLEAARAALIEGENVIGYTPNIGGSTVYCSRVITAEPNTTRYEVRVLTPETYEGAIYSVCENLLKPLTDNSELLGKIAGTHGISVSNGTAYIKGYTIPTELPDGEYEPKFMSVSPLSDVPKLPENEPADNIIESLVSINISDLVKASKFCAKDLRGLDHIHLNAGNIDATSAQVGIRITCANDTGDITAMLPANEMKTLALLGERIIYMCTSELSGGKRVYGVLDTGATFTYWTKDSFPGTQFSHLIQAPAMPLSDYSGYTIPEDQKKFIPKKYESVCINNGQVAKILRFSVNQYETIITTCKENNSECAQ